MKKRTFDICLSFSILILFFWLYVLIGLAIYISSPGSALFTQLRLGKGGKVFKCFKFRTMHLNADKSLRDLLLANPQFRDEWDKNQKLRDDPRIFSFGKFLRKTSLDELPQFWNVLKGEMSIVGPRPYMVYQRKEMGKETEKIFAVRPGLTGLWQTSGRSKTSFRERICLDARYVEKKCSIWSDLYIVIKTIPHLFFPKDAF